LKSEGRNWVGTKKHGSKFVMIIHVTSWRQSTQL